MGTKASRRLARKPSLPAAKPEPNAPGIRHKPGKTNLRREAKVMVDGVAMNAMVGLVFSTKFGALDLTECFAQVLNRVREAANRDTKSQEAILVGQIISMNAVYTGLAIIARQNLSNLAVFERLMRLALRAQSNCRATAEALGALQNPPTVFARQANFANGPQQVNNGVPAPALPARAGNQEIEPNKLLEAHDERLDGGTASAAVSGDSHLAPVGAVHRATKRGR